jgi:hypothetical protein
VQRPLQPIVVDVGVLTEPDPLILDALVRLQLAANRLGATVRLENACSELVDLLALVGLSDVLPVVDGSGVDRGREIDRQIEQWEQLLVDEVVDPGDLTA